MRQILKLHPSEVRALLLAVTTRLATITADGDKQSDRLDELLVVGEVNKLLCLQSQLHTLYGTYTK